MDTELAEAGGNSRNSPPSNLPQLIMASENATAGIVRGESTQLPSRDVTLNYTAVLGESCDIFPYPGTVGACPDVILGCEAGHDSNGRSGDELG